jgi:hypothetical protein
MKDLLFFPERAVVFQPAEAGGAADFTREIIQPALPE